jgi:hypothetical protein
MKGVQTMNAYEFHYVDHAGEHHAEAVDGRDLDGARSFFHLTHPKGVDRIISVQVERTGREHIERPLMMVQQTLPMPQAIRPFSVAGMLG